MKYLYISIILILQFRNSCIAQNCDFFYQKDDIIERITEGYIHNFEKKLTPRAVVKLPIVVHVIYRNSEENISDAQIQSQIDVLNQDFRKKNIDAKDVPGSFKAIAADCEIEFCLASKDTLGNATSGITRHATTISEIGTAFSGNRRRVFYSDLGGENTWKPESYINIWVCNMGTILGYTSPLKDAATKPKEDGILVDYRVFGTIGTTTNKQHNKGRTTTHEMGHYFNLLHIWGTDSTCVDDDLVSDTPLQADANLGCPSFPKLSCNVSSMYMNFMDYTDDDCMGLFTNGQKVRMLAALNEFRSGLLRGSNCEPTSTSLEIDKGIRLYPNPAKDVLYLESNSSTATEIALYDVLGHILYHKTWNFISDKDLKEIPISSYTEGIYFLSIKTKDKTTLKKFVIKR